MLVLEAGGSTTVSYEQMRRRSNEVATWLREQAVGRGDPVVLRLGNQVELWEAMLAVVKLGAVVMPTTTAVGPDDRVDRVSRAGARHVIRNASYTAKFEQVSGNYARSASERSTISLVLTLWLHEELDVLPRQAVRNAVLAQSWSEIGSALGVSKQAAHRKFVHLLAEDVRSQKRVLKQAQRDGKPAAAGAALTAALEGVNVLKQVGRRPWESRLILATLVTSPNSRAQSTLASRQKRTLPAQPRRPACDARNHPGQPLIADYYQRRRNTV